MVDPGVERYAQFQRDGKVDEVNYLPGAWPPAGLEDVNALAERMIEVFCGFINQFTKADGMGEPYEPGQFYYRKVKANYETDWYWAIVLEVYDGDDGGSSVLTGYWTIPMVTLAGPRDETVLRYMAHEFDTTVGMIYDEGEYTRSAQD